MKIFEFKWTSQDESEWVAANTLIEALKTYLATTGMDITELEDDDEIIEVPKEKWPELNVRNTDFDPKDPDDWEEQTFEQWMGENHTPGIIAGTMYD